MKIKFRGESLVVTNHALKRFLERWPQYQMRPSKDPLDILERLLNKAKEERLDPVATVKRLLNNKMKDAEYFMNSGWRFVIVRDHANAIPRLVTIERSSF